MQYPVIDETTRIARLEPPTKRVRAVLDTDTYNEIDDQFALAYALLSPAHIDLEAVYAAPFHNSNSTGPEDGMEKSYEEILRLLRWLEQEAEGFAFRGSRSYLPAAEEPVASPATEDLITRAMKDTEEPLYVAAIGAITNVASAILIEPEIINRIVVVWLGGHPTYWPNTLEFNLMQDLHAARVILDSGVPFVQIPCKNVAEHLRTTVAELETYLLGHSDLCDYLVDIVRGYSGEHFAWSKVIWDISAIAWLINADWVPSTLRHSPILTDQVTWSRDTRRHFVRIADNCNRDAIFGDVFRKLRGE